MLLFSFIRTFVPRKRLKLRTMKRKMLWTIVFLFLPLQFVSAQSWENEYQQYMNMDDIESSTWEETSELLSELEQHPLNLNAITREQLERLPFLTDQEIEDICAYVYRYAPLKSMGELAMMASLDANKRRLLQCFVYLGEVEQQDSVGIKHKVYDHHEVIFTAKIPFYQREGDKGDYLGECCRHQFRYRYQHGKHLRLGLVGAQDAGEPFLKNKNKMGYDFYSYYLMVNEWKRVKSAIVGKYRMSMGMGLVINNDFMLGKTTALASMGRQRQVLQPHSSTSPDHYLQGIAATLRLSPQWTFTPFFSYRLLDGTVNKDSLTISSIVTGGYHRTVGEMAKKDNTGQTTAGSQLVYKQGTFHVGLGAVYTHVSRSLNPNRNVIYRYYYPRGKDFMNIGTDYGWRSGRFALSGETAIDRKGALATMNTVSYRLMPELNMLVVQRFYGMKYEALHAQSFSEGGRVQNESGIYLGMEWKPSHQLVVSAYGDWAYFPWARYQVSRSSKAQDYQATMTYHWHDWSFSLRYRLRLKEKDNEEKTALMVQQEQRARLLATYHGTKLSSRTQIDLVSIGKQTASWGWSISQQMGYQLSKNTELHAGAAYFHTDDYSSRLYLYERGMLYQFSNPVCYGHGIRYSLMFKAQLSHRLLVNIKAGVTDYFDRSSISSGLQQINHSSQTDLDLQVKWRL